MPIIIPGGEVGQELQTRLEMSGVNVLGQKEAGRQDIRPARIGILNLMPAIAMERTETQWLRYMCNSVLQIEPVFIKFDDDAREEQERSRGAILSRYQPFSTAIKNGIDGLIVTGDNLEIGDNSEGAHPQLLDFKKIDYAPQLTKVIEWARENVHSTIYSCLASHFALNVLYGLERDQPDTKIFGVYDHLIDGSSNSSLVAGLDDIFRAPHSRWGNISLETLGKTAVKLLASNPEIGWLLAQDDNNAGGQDVFMQGHPEYDRNDLREEHKRDGNSVNNRPAGYYRDDGTPYLSWANDARALHANWINSLYRHFSTPKEPATCD